MIVLITARRFERYRQYEQCQCGCGDRFPRRHMVNVPSPFPGASPDRVYVRHAIEAGYGVRALVQKRR